MTFLLRRNVHAAILLNRLAVTPPATLILAVNRLQPTLEAPSRGMKWVAQPKRRCPHCYYEVMDEILYVFCPQSPKHRQGKLQGPQKFNGTILTHATHGGPKKFGMNTQSVLRADF